MFHLMERVPNGVQPMLEYLEAHIISTGLADMKAHAETITTVSRQTDRQTRKYLTDKQAQIDRVD